MNRFTIPLLLVLVLLPTTLTAQGFTSVTAPALTGTNPNSGISDVAYNDKQRVYLQVWGHPIVYGRFVTADGAAIGAQPFVIAQQSASDAMPRVEYSTGGSDDVFVVRFTSELDRGQYLFVLNRGDVPATVPARGTDLLTGEVADGNLRIGAGSAAVVREATG